MKKGLFIGRFQVFHLGHLRDVKTALEEVSHLAIGVGSSNESNTKQNPFSYRERKEMINKALQEEGVKDYEIKPIPDFHDDEKWVFYIEKNIAGFDVVYISDKNTRGERWVERCFKGKKPVKKLKPVPGISATRVREEMLSYGKWKEMVPKEVAQYLESIRGVERIKKTG